VPRSTSHESKGERIAPIASARTAATRRASPPSPRPPRPRCPSAVEELGGRVDHDVRAEREWPLEERAHERVVDDQDGAWRCATPASARMSQIFMRGSSASRSRRGRSGPPPSRTPRVGGVDEDELHPVAGEDLGEEPVGSAVHVVGDHDALADLTRVSTAWIAAMPEAKQVASTPPSSAARFFSSERRVRLWCGRTRSPCSAEPLLDVGGGLVDGDGHGPVVGSGCWPAWMQSVAKPWGHLGEAAI